MYLFRKTRTRYRRTISDAVFYLQTKYFVNYLSERLKLKLLRHKQRNDWKILARFLASSRYVNVFNLMKKRGIAPYYSFPKVDRCVFSRPLNYNLPKSLR